MHFQRSRYFANLLLEVEVYVVGHHLPDDPDKLAGTVPDGIVVSPAFRHLLIVVRFKGGIPKTGQSYCL